MRTGLNQRSLTVLSLVILAVAAVAASFLAVSGKMLSAAALAGLLLLAGLFMAQRSRLPAIFSLLFVTAMLVNTVGYIWDLWDNPVWFDEAVHFYTSFTIVAAIGWLLFSRTRLSAAHRTGRFIAAVTGIGVALGLLWEVFEWVIGIIGSPTDTVIDIVMDTLGAIAAGLFCTWAASQERKADAHR